MGADASIYSQIHPAVPLEGPLDQYSKLISLKSLMGNEQLNEMQRTKLGRDMQEEDAFKKLFAGATPEQVNAPDFLTKAMGASPSRGLALQKTQLENQKAQAELFKTKLETGAKALELHRDALTNVNDPQAAAEWVKAAYSDPNLAPIAAHGGTVEQAIARIPTDPAQFAEWKRNSSAGAGKLLELNQQLSGQKETARHNAATEVQSAATLEETKRGHNLTDTRTRELNGILAGQTSEPSPDLVKSIANHDIELKAPPTNARNPIMLERYGKILAAVKKENPGWSAEQFPTVKKMEGYMATGEGGKTMRALSNATGHLDTYERLALAMQNGDSQVINSIVNKVKQQFGSDVPTNPAAVAQFLSAEIVKAAAGAAGGVSDREHMASIFANKSSPDQMVGAANTVREIMGQQFRSLGQQYESGTYGRKDFADKYLKLPEVRAAYDKAVNAHAAPGAPAAGPGGAPNALPKGSGGIKFLGWETPEKK